MVVRLSMHAPREVTGAQSRLIHDTALLAWASSTPYSWRQVSLPQRVGGTVFMHVSIACLCAAFALLIVAFIIGAVAVMILLGVFLAANVADSKVSGNKINPLLLLANLHSFIPVARSTSSRCHCDLLHPALLPSPPPACFSKQQLLVLVLSLARQLLLWCWFACAATT